MSDVQQLAEITVDWPTDPAFQAVGRLVLAGVAARTTLAVDRVDELGLAIDALARIPTTAESLRLEIRVEDTALVACVGSFSRDPLADSAVKRVVEALADESESVERTGERWVELTLRLPVGG